MMNNGVPYYRKPVLDHIARNVLNSFDPRILMSAPRAVPIEEIIEAQGLIIEYQHLRKDMRVLGETVFENAEIPIYDMQAREYTTIFVEAGTILIDARLLMPGQEGRMRYTLAHELSHWLLHKKLFLGSDCLAAKVDSPDHALSSEAEQDVERQADLLATTLLIPIVKVKQAFYSLQGQLNSDGIVSRLAALFGVSKQAMRIRLTRHNLI